MNLLFGKLTLDALPHEWFTVGGTLFITCMFIVLAIFLTKTHRWKWLWKEWLTSVDPKKIGIMYLIGASLMLFRGGIDAIMMWMQQSMGASNMPGLMGAQNGFLDPTHFQEIATAHGNIMVFFVTMGFLFGLMNLIIPLQIGARDVASPLLNTLGFWLYVAGAVLINMFFVFGGHFSATGWLAAMPLSELKYSPGVGVDYWVWSLQISGLGTLLGGINFILTVLKMRAPGMTLRRLPMFTWASFCGMILVISVFPILAMTTALLFLDRFLGMHFFTTGHGGNPMMYINLIWSWGHPEIYILILPIFGVYSEVVATFSRKRIFGYTTAMAATFLVMVVSALVWLHHFFTMGAGGNVNAVFGVATEIIAIPTGVLIFNWLFTMYGGKIKLSTAMYWFLGFLCTFSFGGLAGVMMGVAPIDFQVHNSLFLIAHFHTMVIGGALFGIFSGINYWFPKIAGFKLNERLGKYSFWLWIVGFLVAFVPLYILGIMGATRRMDSYPAANGWQPFFMIAFLGGLIIVCAVAMQVLQFVVSVRDRKKNQDTTGDPWNGRTLEWATSSPPPVYNFAVVPEVYSRDAFWEMKQKGLPQPHYEDIHMPKNTGAGVYISAFALILGFAMVWQIIWLALVGLIGAVVCLIFRAFDEDTEYTIPAEEVERIESERKHV